MSAFDAEFSGAITAGVASAALRPGNPARREITVVNTHATQDAYLELATDREVAPTAVVGEGIYLKAGGGSWTSNVWKGAVACIAAGAGTVLTVVEF